MGEESVRPEEKGEHISGQVLCGGMVSCYLHLVDWYLQTVWEPQAQLDRRAHVLFVFNGNPSALCQENWAA